MSLTSIGGSSGLSVLSQNIRNATAAAGRSVGRLSSGKRISGASDDVASLSVSIHLFSGITSLKQAGKNLAQADSLLQVIDGALQQTDSLLQRMNALAVQASSGSLTAVDRSFLNQEFQQLINEIDRIARTTTFGDVAPLDNSAISEKTYIDALTTDDAQADSYSALLVFSGNWSANNRYIRLGTFDTSPNERFYWRNNPNLGNPAFNFKNSSSLDTKLLSMVERWNDPSGAIQQDERFSQVRMELVNNNTVKIVSRTRGDLAQLFAISDSSAHTDVRNAMQVIGEDFQRNGASTLFNYVLQSNNDGSATGLGMGSVTAVGSTGSGIISDISQKAGEIRLTMTGKFINNQQLRIDNGQTGTVNFAFRNNVTNPSLHIKIGKDTIETLDNAVTFFNNWVEQQKNTASYQTWYGVANLAFSREGNDLVIRSVVPGKPVDLFGTNFNFVETLTNGVLNNGVATSNNLNLVGGVDRGVNVSGISNKDFVGNLRGFKATYVDQDQVNLSIQVGDATYQAMISDTIIPSNERIRFVSDNNGYFDVDLMANHGQSVADQNGADHFAALFDTAFDGVTFYQERVISNFKPPSSSVLSGTRLSIRSERFDQPLLIEEFSVKSKEENAGNAEVRIVINGEEYRSTQLIDRGIRSTASVQLISTQNSNHIVTFNNLSSQAFDLDTASQASLFEEEMLKYLPFGYADQAGETSISFQAGRRSLNEISVSTYDATTKNIFDQPMDLLTKESATEVVATVQAAIHEVTAMRAENGATQQQVIMAQSYIGSAVQSQVAAHSVLTDTDLSFEATRMAMEYVKVNAGISLHSQINRLRSDLISTLLQ